MVYKESSQHGIVRRRFWLLLVILILLIGTFSIVLYNLQVIHGDEYLERSQRKIAKTETVEAARGNILDTSGRVLVTNRTQYQATIDLSLMGNSDQRNATLAEIISLCRSLDVNWNDTLPITPSSPFHYTSASPFFSVSTTDEGAEKRSLTKFGRLAVAEKWISDPTEEEFDGILPSAEQLLASMFETYGLSDSSPESSRAVAGILYESALRSKEITWSPYIFAENVDIKLISTVKERHLVGIQFKTTTTRQYNTSYAAHLLGRVALMNSDEWKTYKELGYSMDAVIGKDGVEKAFESHLHGTAGTRIIETNTSGKIVSETWKVDPISGKVLTPDPGDHVVMTLNLRLQEAVEQSLATHVPTLPEAEGAAAVVLDVRDASVLAMASYPTFDLANFSQVWNDIKDDPLSPMFNRATQGIYAPGSTFKMVTAIGALEEGIITPYDHILDTGYYTYYTHNIDQAPKCWIYRQYGRTHGLVNVSQAITDSCNIFFYDVGRRLGIDKLNEYARMFGLGQSTGIELDERIGVIAGRDYTENVLHEPWYDGSTLSVAIGQENNQFTPLQLANYIATMVNGGKHHAAHLLKEVKSSDYSQVVYEYEPRLLAAVDIDPVNLDAVKQGMYALTQPGGSLYYYFTGVDTKVGAKTGSAQVAGNSEANALLVAFAPYDNPEIALCITVEKGGSGSELGAIAADIISFYFDSESQSETG